MSYYSGPSILSSMYCLFSWSIFCLVILNRVSYSTIFASSNENQKLEWSEDDIMVVCRYRVSCTDLWLIHLFFDALADVLLQQKNNGDSLATLIQVSCTFHSVLTPREERALALEALREGEKSTGCCSRSAEMKWTKCLELIDRMDENENTHFSTITAGIWTNCTGLLLSFNACVKFKICPLITDIWRSNKRLSKPLSCCNTERKKKN